jgi:hypothetical protein
MKNVLFVFCVVVSVAGGCGDMPSALAPSSYAGGDAGGSVDSGSVNLEPECLSDKDCDDGDLCTEGEACNNGKCVKGKEKDCSDAFPCTYDHCSEGFCGHLVMPDGVSCTDDSPCSLDGICKSGWCEQGKTCNDGNACTIDFCDAVSAKCMHMDWPVDDICYDDNICTEESRCLFDEAGIFGCVAVTLKDCDDGDQCTTDSCIPSFGCDHTYHFGPCDDGSICTNGERCNTEGLCSIDGPVAGVEMDCDDQNPCTDDACDSVEGCIHTNNTAKCDDENGCTINDMCKEGLCSGIVDMYVIPYSDADGKDYFTCKGCKEDSECALEYFCHSHGFGGGVPTWYENQDIFHFTGKCVKNACEVAAESCADGNIETHDTCTPTYTTTSSPGSYVKNGQCQHKPLPKTSPYYGAKATVDECWCKGDARVCESATIGEDGWSEITASVLPCPNGCEGSDCKKP